MAAKKIEDKKIFAKGDKVFTHIGPGLWTAELYGNPVILERVKHDHWKCIDEKTNGMLGDGSTRNEAMREAFYNEAAKKGYDGQEANRLEWILVSQKYRSYGGHKARRKTVNISNTKEGYYKTNIDKLEKSPPSSDIEKYSQDAAERIQQALSQYKTAYNAVLGGWHYYKRDEKGNIEDGKIYGAFKNEKEMFRHIMHRELKKFK